MIISKKRINSVEKYLKCFSENSEIYICVQADEHNKNILCHKKVISKYNIGELVVPAPVGPITNFNLEGKYVVKRNEEKEKRTVEREYHVVDWHGQDHYGTCYSTIECYPREYIFPPLERIQLGKEYIKSRIFKINEKELIKHVVNMFLEIFGICILTDNEECPITKETEIKRVQWKILPQGKYPWEVAEKELESFFERVKPKQRRIIQNRHRMITQNAPDFMAIGEDSFNGYVVYGYNEKKVYVFESNEINNATYVFGDEWEKVSKLTKKEIISDGLCSARIIHNSEWEGKISCIFKN